MHWLLALMCGALAVIAIAATGPTQASPMLVGANVHPWPSAASFNANITYVKASLTKAGIPNRGIVRWDEQIPSTPVEQIVARYDEVTALGLASDIILVTTAYDNPNIFADYLAFLVPAMGARRPFVIEMGNEPNYFPVGHAWQPAVYAQALKNASAVRGPLRLSMAGLALNDQAYLKAMGPLYSISSFSNLHLYTRGGSPTVGPLAPDDLDIAHGGLFSVVQGITEGPQIVGKPLIVGEFGWQTGELQSEAQRASYFRAVVSLARSKGHVAALIPEEIGAGDGSGPNLMGTQAWDAFIEAAAAP